MPFVDLSLCIRRIAETIIDEVCTRMIARREKIRKIWDRYCGMIEFHEEEKEIEIPKRKEMCFFLSKEKKFAWKKNYLQQLFTECPIMHLIDQNSDETCQRRKVSSANRDFEHEEIRDGGKTLDIDGKGCGFSNDAFF